MSEYERGVADERARIVAKLERLRDEQKAEAARLRRMRGNRSAARREGIARLYDSVAFLISQKPPEVVDV